MLPGVAATVRELATANVIVTAAALLVVCACDSAANTRLSVSAAITKVTFLNDFNITLHNLVLISVRALRQQHF
jgi:hypothetical protein